MGLPLLESSQAPDHVETADELEVDLGSGRIQNISKEITFQANPIPAFMQELIADGGLMKHIAKKLSFGIPTDLGGGLK